MIVHQCGSCGGFCGGGYTVNGKYRFCKAINPTKPTQTNLSEYLGMTKQGLTKMKKERPKVFELLWLGWVEKTKQG